MNVTTYAPVSPGPGAPLPRDRGRPSMSNRRNTIAWVELDGLALPGVADWQDAAFIRASFSG